MHDVISFQKPGHPRTAIVATAGLLAACLGAAQLLVHSRELGPLTHLTGWAVGFRTPRGWLPQTQTDTVGARVAIYREPEEHGPSREVVFSRLSNPDEYSPKQLCGKLLENRLGLAWVLLARGRIALEAMPLGPLPGVRCLMLEPQGLCLHVGTVVRSSGVSEAYTLELHADRPFDHADMALFDALARSIEAIPERDGG